MRIFSILFFLFSSISMTANDLSTDTLRTCGNTGIELIVSSASVDSVAWYIVAPNDTIELYDGLTLGNQTFHVLSDDSLLVTNSFPGDTLNVFNLQFISDQPDTSFFVLIWFEELNDLTAHYDVCELASILIPTQDAVRYTYLNNTPVNLTSDSVFIEIFPSSDSLLLIRSFIDTSPSCNSVDTIVVTYFTLPHIEMIDELQICSGDTTLIEAEITGFSSITWSPSFGPSSQGGTNIEVSFSTSTILYLTAFNNEELNCSTRDSVVVQVLPLPIISAGEDKILCLGDTTVITAFVTDSFNWSPTDGLIDPLITQPEVVTSIDKTYTLTAINEFGCINKDQVFIDVKEIPDILLDGSTSACVGSALTLTASGGLTYIWSSSPGLTVISDSEASVVLNEPNTYSVIGLNEFGCSSTSSLFIDTLITPRPSISGPEILCSFESLAAFILNWEPNTTISWIVGGGEVIGQPELNRIFVNWTSPADECSISATTTALESNCATSDLFQLNFSDVVAPSYASVFQLTNSLLGCSDESSSIYRWGKTNRFNGIEEIVQVGQPYCYYDLLDISLFYYWVEHGNDFDCLTRSYYNIPSYYIGMGGQQEVDHNPIDVMVVYPNPVKDIFQINGIQFSETKITIEIYSSIGQRVMMTKLDEQGRVDITSLEDGLYTVLLRSSYHLYSSIIVKI